MNKKLLVIALGGTILLQSCATLFGGGNASVKIPAGTPQTAKIYVDGNYEGTAPKTVKISKSSLKAGSIITIKADGYKEQNVTVRRKMQTGFLILDIIPGIGIGFLIDMITGNIYKASPDKINYELENTATTANK